MNWPRAACRLACFTVLSVFAGEGAGSENPSKATSPGPALVSELTRELSIRPTQTTRGADPLFSLDESCLSHADFNEVAASVPWMSSFLKAAPTRDHKSGLNSSIPVAYHQKWPGSLCQYSLGSFNARGSASTAALLSEARK